MAVDLKRLKREIESSGHQQQASLSVSQPAVGDRGGIPSSGRILIAQPKRHKYVSPPVNGALPLAIW
jgi:hypothetical protein